MADANSIARPALSSLDAAWVAGFLDGEGSFQIKWQRSKRDCHMTSSVATVCVSQAEPRTEVLYWLKAMFGGSVVSHGTERRNAKHNKSLRWGITGAGAVAVCEAVLPYLRLKKRHAALILEHQATKLSAHVGVRKGTKRADLRVSPDIVRLRAAHIAEIGALNARGVEAVA